jgi:hypothetical protein
LRESGNRPRIVAHVRQPVLRQGQRLPGRLLLSGALLHPRGNGEAQKPFRDRFKLL